MEKRFQIFVSSTFEDLKDERNAVTKAILELGDIPVGMEMFSAGDEDQWTLIKRQIEQSDYYVVIVAQRYGSLTGNISFTEKEYNYAVEKKIPVLGFVLQKDAKWNLDRIDRKRSIVTKLNRFKEKIEARYVSHWSNCEELALKVTASLSKQKYVNPRPGWVRAPAIASSAFKFELIDAMAHPVESQAAIWMFENDDELRVGDRYICGGVGTGQLGSYDNARLERVGIVRRSAGGNNLALSEEGRVFAAWLIQKRRKAPFFYTTAGGWGQVEANYRKHAEDLKIPIP